MPKGIQRKRTIERFCGNPECEKSLASHVRTQRYCRAKCREHANSLRRKQKTIERRKNRKCVECYRPIPVSFGSQALVCSKTCRFERNARLAQNKPPCKMDGCNTPIGSVTGPCAGLCPAHAWRLKHGKDLDPTVLRWSDREQCAFIDCVRPPRAMGLCASHYEQSRNGQQLRVIGTKSNGGLRLASIGTTKTKQGGYVRIRTLDGWSYQHTAVMQNHLGRPLLKHENVHHINGIPGDNRIENLELWSKSHPAGQRVIDKIKWAEDILKLYKPQRHLFEDLPID